MEIALGIPTIADAEDTALTDWRRIDDATAQRGLGQKSFLRKAAIRMCIWGKWTTHPSAAS
ncbi:hypothetical protein [Bradyrhizobium sp. WSM1743]|uniref:hypothetical protein n=1 Tax=Bradyrhizobium sp. WSM1743 TaxID=318996 RepID=UPI000419FF49|nr:hypothetical protein [Bradyrhizobium sp. WSM1743]